MPEGGAGGGDAGGLVDGRYRLRELLGSGGMAEVYLAYDVVLDRAVALKMMHGRYADSTSGSARGSARGSAPSIGPELRREVVARFRREARAAGGLSHPSIVAVYDQGSCEDGTPYIAMEYVPGGTLKDGIRRYGAIPPRAAAETALQIANALAAAHERGMVHRDIKPHNILITASGDVKVTDFGIARAAADATASVAASVADEASPPGRLGSGDPAGSGLTATGVVMGTAGYISPEQALGEPAGPQSDLYSLGVTLYEMLTGELPFRAETPIATAVKHVGEPPRPPREVNPAVPPGLDAVTRRLLEKEPRRRYADAGALADDLQRLLDEPDPPVVEAEPGPAARPAPAPRRHRRRHRSGLLAAALVPILGAALAAYAWAHAPVGGGAGGVREEVARPLGGIGDALEGIPGPVGGDRAQAEPSKAVAVPDVVGMQLEEARGEGSPAEDFEVVEDGRVASDEPAGEIVEQKPSPSEGPDGGSDAEGPTLEKGSEISVVVSEKRLAEVPDVVGTSRDGARRALDAAGFEARFRDGESSPEEEGLALSQSPGPDARAEAGSPVSVTFGTGPAEVGTPDLRGGTLEAARAQLEDAGLRLGGTERRPSEGTESGDVYAQDPAAGAAVEAGAAVDVSVSTGPPEVGVPDVVGLDLDAAKRAVLDAGLGYTAVGTRGGMGEREGAVLSTDPPAGTTLEPETYVEIVYVADPAEATTPAPPSTTASSPPASSSASPPASAPASPPETQPFRPPEGSGDPPAPPPAPPPITPPITSGDGDREPDREPDRGISQGPERGAERTLGRGDERGNEDARGPRRDR